MEDVVEVFVVLWRIVREEYFEEKLSLGIL